jgi:exodeoxyribonuclease VII large subunit
MNNIPEFSVTEFSNLAKNILEENFSLIRVRGEISSVKNFKGHLYFTIKDENFVLNSVCWASKVPYLQIQPEDGIEVIAEGKISTYAKSSISTYQLQVNQIEIKGEGALLKLIEQRKKKLQEEGLFDDQNKKTIPVFPKNIGVITSPTGAVIMDIIDRIEARFPTNIKLYPVSVQGANTVNEVIAGLKFFENNKVDTLIIARGGGGIEDLMPFNDENLVREVYKFKTPIISAIGHETDFTLLDFVADLRAATPTAAAEQAVPELKTLLEKKSFLEKSLTQTISNFINNNLRILKNINSIFNSKVLRKIINDNKKNLSLVMKSINFNLNSLIKMKYIELRRLGSLVSTLNIDDILKRGFVLVRDKNMRIIKNSKTLKKNKNINIKFFDDALFAEIKIKNERS